MSTDKKTPLEEEFEKHYSSEKGAWTNAWSPTWEDTDPFIGVSSEFQREDLPEESDISSTADEEEPE